MTGDGTTRGRAISLEARRLIFGQDPARSPVGEMECALGLITLDEDWAAGYLDAAYLTALRGLLARSPWAGEERLRAWCRDQRGARGIGPERFWWWPESWAGGGA